MRKTDLSGKQLSSGLTELLDWQLDKYTTDAIEGSINLSDFVQVNISI